MLKLKKNSILALSFGHISHLQPSNRASKLQQQQNLNMRGSRKY